MKEIVEVQLFAYQPDYVVKWHTLEKTVYFDFYNGEWVGYLATDKGKRVCKITSVSKIFVDAELKDFDAMDLA